jgi:peptidoglycan-N-acetylglucosamine deacetylase
MWFALACISFCAIALVVVSQIYQADIIRGCLVHWYPGITFRSRRLQYLEDRPHKIMSITIDDVPTKHTKALLALLREPQFEHHKLTFFVIGERAWEYADGEILDEISDDGHEIGNHDWTDHTSAFCSWDTFTSGFERTESVIGVRKWFRPGGGAWTRRMIDWVRSRGYGFALADIYSRDPGIPFASFHRWYLRRELRPGSIAVFHDGRPWTMATVRGALETLNEAGYTSVTLTKLQL